MAESNLRGFWLRLFFVVVGFLIPAIWYGGTMWAHAEDSNKAISAIIQNDEYHFRDLEQLRADNRVLQSRLEGIEKTLERIDKKLERTR